MYIALLTLALGGSAWLALSGASSGRRMSMLIGASGVLLTLLFFGFMSLWGEALWFDALGYGRRFWLFIVAGTATAAAAAALAALATYLLILPLRERARGYDRIPIAVAAAGGALQGAAGWQLVLMFLNGRSAGVTEPILGADAGFYLFTLPFLDELADLLLWSASVALGAVLVALLKPNGRTSPVATRADADRLTRPLLVASLGLAIAVALQLALAPFHLLYSEAGIVTGPGWSDVFVRLPGYWLLSVAVPALVVLPFVPAIRRRIGASVGGLLPEIRSQALFATAAAWAAAALLWFVVIEVSPWLAQRLYVEPNEITLERPYITHNIEFTRRGFDLRDIEERQYPIGSPITRETIDRNAALISEVRLWDWRALDAVYRQFQEIRLYYEFADVDIDRYRLGNDYRQVMASARELAPENLPSGSQTFVNRRFKYTHGYGVTLATVRDFTASGLPNLLIRDIPPVSEHPDLAVRRPEIYYGELTREPVVVNTTEPEFDYPSGDQNIYTRYEGTGGVEMRGLWRKFLFGWKFDGTELLLSSYPQPDSRFMFHREVTDRARRIAPFLRFDEDPYVVLAGGRLYWILDAYTYSTRYPYSAALSPAELTRTGLQNRTDTGEIFLGVNYLRNSVKVVIDAYHGNVDFYVFEPEDPIIGVWQDILPGVFHDGREMPDALRDHVRYPQDLLLTQGLVYAKYHMSDPTVFYNQEDLWVRATEKHYDRIQPVEPYYVMWQLPGSDEAEFVLMLPFTPKDRQVLIGWIAGLSDAEHYGRFIAYKFPKEKRVLGPQQVETKIDQDRFLSGQLTLWDQRGSNVIRGNVLAIPLDGSLLYVEPIYLEAETAAYPELRIVVTMQGDNMSYGETFDEALMGLLGERGAGEPRPELSSGAGISTMTELASEANTAFERYLETLGSREFDEAAAALQRLEQILSRMTGAGQDAQP